MCCNRVLAQRRARVTASILLTCFTASMATAKESNAEDIATWKHTAVVDALWTFFRVEKYHEGIEEICIRDSGSIPRGIRVGTYKTRVLGALAFLRSKFSRERGIVLVTVNLAPSDQHGLYAVKVWASSYRGYTETRREQYGQGERTGTYVYRIDQSGLKRVSKSESRGLLREARLAGMGPPSGEFTGKLMKVQINRTTVLFEGRKYSDEEVARLLQKKIGVENHGKAWEVRIYWDYGEDDYKHYYDYIRHLENLEVAIRCRLECKITLASSLLSIDEPRITVPKRSSKLLQIQGRFESK